MKDILYIVVSTDRHRDNIYTLFKTQEKAINFAKCEFRAITGRFKIPSSQREDYDELIESNRYASFLDGDYKVSIEKTNYPI
jgi:hypothetical protein